MIKRFFKESTTYGLNTIVSRALSLILIPLYTRFFSPADFGIIDMLAMFTALVNLVVPLQISQAIARHYSDAGTKTDKVRYSSTALWFNLFAYALFVLIALSASKPMSRLLLESTSAQPIFRIAIFSTALVGIFYHIQGQLRWQFQAKDYAISNICYVLTSACLTITLITVYHAGLKSVFVGMAAAGTLAGAVAWFFARQSFKFTFDWNKCKEMITFSAPLVPLGLSVFVSSYADRLAIRQLMPLEALGLYGVGWRFASVIAIILSGFQGALMPLVYGNYKEPTTPGQLDRILRYLLCLVLPVVLCLTLFSHELLRIFATPQYYAAASVISLLSFSILFTNLSIFAPGLFIARKTGIIAGIGIIGAVSNAILSFILVRIWGITGAALGSFLSATITFMLYIVASQKFYFIPYRWKKIAFAAVATLLLSFLGGTQTRESSSYLLPIAIKVLLLLCGTFVAAWSLIEFREVKQIVVQVLKRMKK